MGLGLGRMQGRQRQGQASLADGRTNLLACTEQVVPIFPAPSNRSDRALVRVMGWRAVLVLAAVCSLTLALATRYSYGTLSPSGHTVKALPAEGKVQRLLVKDGLQAWIPVERFVFATLLMYAAHIVVNPSPIALVEPGSPVSNRAPPLSARLS